MKVKLKTKGVRALLRSPAVEADLKRRAVAIEAAAGPGHAVDSEIGRNRARASVRTQGPHQNLLQALDAGRR